MRKLGKTLLALTLCLPIVGCGKDAAPESSVIGTQSDTLETTMQAEYNDTNIAASDDIEFFGTFEDPSYPVVFDYPVCRLTEEGYSRIFARNGYVVVYCKDAGDAALTDINTQLTDQFVKNAEDYINGYFDSFSITSSEEKTVNGTDALMIDGALIGKYDDGNTISSPMHGYTFSKGGAICELLGIVNDEPTDELVDEMTKTVDAMINTLRDER